MEKTHGDCWSMRMLTGSSITRCWYMYIEAYMLWPLIPSWKGSKERVTSAAASFSPLEFERRGNSCFWTYSSPLPSLSPAAHITSIPAGRRAAAAVPGDQCAVVEQIKLANWNCHHRISDLHLHYVLVY